MKFAKPDVISLAEAARRLGVSYVTARRMAAKGDFPGLISATRASGTRRPHLVSVPRFEAIVHGKAAS